MGIIYKITNLVNKKIYIGQTVRTLEQRWSEHKHTALKEDKTTYPLYNAMRKYGIKSFTIELIEECDNSILNDREQYWISYFNSHGNNGYNATDGGETIGDKLCKFVQQIKDNKVIATFNSIREAERQTGIANQNISIACHIPTRTAGGYHWRFVNEDYPKPIIKYKVYCVELNRYFKTVAEAARFIHQDYSETSIRTIDNNIRRSIKKNIKAYDFSWKNV